MGCFFVLKGRFVALFLKKAGFVLRVFFVLISGRCERPRTIKRPALELLVKKFRKNLKNTKERFRPSHPIQNSIFLLKTCNLK